MEYNNILFENKGGVAWVTINRPEAMNALNPEVLLELGQVFAAIGEDTRVKLAVITGAGRAFVAGADIAAMREMDADTGRSMAIKGQAVMDAIEQCPKPVIAAVNGFALGGGCELAMACDFRIASEKASFAQPEVGLGIIPGFGGTQRLPRLVGTGMAKYLTYTAERIDAATAKAIGLVEKVVPPEELVAEVEKVAGMIMAKSQIAVRQAKCSINAGAGCDLRTAIAYEAEAFAVSFASDERTEGMSAFLEKRAPNFK